MDPSNWLLLDLNLSLSDANAPRFESSNNSILHQLSKNEENGELVEELYRMNTENKKLTQMLTSICDNYQVLHSQLINYMGKNPKLENCVESDPKKRKAYFEVLNSEEIQGNSEQSCISYEDSYKRARLLNSKPILSKISIRTENSDTKLVVKDGYQWRKYGQKVTRDNPSPRAYFKCASAPTACPVKKKVQRSMEDPYILVATYEGEHNHAKPSSRDIDHIVLDSSHPLNSSYFSATNLNMNRHESIMNPSSSNSKIDDEQKSPNAVDEHTKSLQRFLTEKIVDSLTRDPSFKTTLATAISGKMMNGTIYETWL